jgi:diadenosine tetraphosphate (Ap4A) HIT family hydrolase
MSPCPLCERIAAAKTLATFAAEFEHSVLFVGDHQVFPGYCVLVAKTHSREQHELPTKEAMGVYEELLLCCRAIENAFKPWKLNLSSYGNVVSHVHWHIMPRYENDPQRLSSPWLQMDRFNQQKTTPDEASLVATKVRQALGKFAKPLS